MNNVLGVSGHFDVFAGVVTVAGFAGVGVCCEGGEGWVGCWGGGDGGGDAGDKGGSCWGGGCCEGEEEGEEEGGHCWLFGRMLIGYGRRDGDGLERVSFRGSKSCVYLSTVEIWWL